MTIKQYNELVQFITILAERAGMCDNQIDKALFSEAAGHLINYQYVMKELKDELQ